MFELFYHSITVITGHTKLMWLGDAGCCCSTHPGPTHHFDVVKPLIDQLLRVLPVGCILWHGLQRRQDLWVEKLQALRGQKSSTLVGGMSRWGRLLCGVTWRQLGEADELWWTITACIRASPRSVTSPSQRRLCVWCVHWLPLTSCGLWDTARPTRPVVWRRTAEETLVTFGSHQLRLISTLYQLLQRILYYYYYLARQQPILPSTWQCFRGYLYHYNELCGIAN